MPDKLTPGDLRLDVVGTVDGLYSNFTDPDFRVWVPVTGENKLFPIFPVREEWVVDSCGDRECCIFFTTREGGEELLPTATGPEGEEVKLLELDLVGLVDWILINNKAGVEVVCLDQKYASLLSDWLPLCHFVHPAGE